MDYQEFLASKALVTRTGGVEVEPDDLHPALFPFQRDLVRWSLRKGKAALFADTGLGKAIMSLSWSLHAGRTLILAPLAVARQTVQEGAKFGIPVTYARSQSAASDGITITNYEMLDHFSPEAFDAVVLDESSVLKQFDGKTCRTLIDAFKDTPMRLCCTATPAPNDIAEMANHAEFLGVMTRAEMLAAFFVHDQDGWRLKGHAHEAFYRWLASWGMSLKRPSDLGYSDDGYILPPLSVTPHYEDVDVRPDGMLFAVGIHGVGDRAKVRKATMQDRVKTAVELVNASPDEPWIVWCGLNNEAEAMAKALPGAVNVYGTMSPDEKADALLAFANGQIQHLVTKSSISGFGMNFQHCARQVFVGLSDSWESYYQCIRRSYRFGQTRPVEVHVVLSWLERPIFDNVMAKEAEAMRMSAGLVKHVAEFERQEVRGAKSVMRYAPPSVKLPAWLGRSQP